VLAGSCRKLRFIALVQGVSGKKVFSQQGSCCDFHKLQISFKNKTQTEKKTQTLKRKKKNQNDLSAKQPPVFGLELVSLRPVCPQALPLKG